jgi:hypothetical protein
MCTEGSQETSSSSTDIPPSPEHYAKVLPPPEILRHVVDVHCHPTDTEILSDVIDSLDIRVCSMSTRRTDQAKVADLARAHPDKVIPAFGECFHLVVDACGTNDLWKKDITHGSRI